jgi:two-component system alkaline phosphatase synthesis response regulator PhoP
MAKNKAKILLVDDEPDILEIVGYNLSQEGYQIMEKKPLLKQNQSCQI